MYGRALAGLWAIFVAYWLFYWIVAPGGRKKTAVRSHGAWRILAAGLVVYVYWRLYRSHGWPYQRFVPRSAVVEISGLVVCAAGIAFAMWARRALGSNWSGNPAIKENHQLISFQKGAGPYRWVRHPIYSGIMLAVLGTVFVDDRWRSATIFLYCVGVVIWRIRVEERLMTREFPKEYASYKAKTKAVIPFVW